MVGCFLLGFFFQAAYFKDTTWNLLSLWHFHPLEQEVKQLNSQQSSLMQMSLFFERKRAESVGILDANYNSLQTQW